MNKTDYVEMGIVKAYLPELLVMARARHAEALKAQGIDISLCGSAANWEECCSVYTIDDNCTQAMLWYNVGKATHAVALDIE